MYACKREPGRGFSEGLSTPSNATVHLHDPPPLRNAKVPELQCQGSGPKRISRRATVDGALAWGRGKPPPEQCPSTAPKPTKHPGR